MSVIKVENLNKSYGSLKVIDNLSFELKGGEQVVIMGASGSGKSTFLYMLGGLEKCNSGKVLVNDRDLTKMSDEALAKYRNKDIGFVFQFHFLLPTIDCLENILMPARLGKANLSKVKSYVLGLAKRLGVEDCLNKFPYQVSGGQQQRINLIRALSLKPKLLLCDEPTGNLDSKNSELVTDLLLELSKEMGTTLIVVTHDDDVAERFEYQIQMVDGILN